ncbi:MAG: response regulator, partial [Gammaproteobacteria bacterium]|nr:response regulator [Gammaproteobacteria bacterium]
KGASRAVRVMDMERICQAMEDRLGQLKRGELAASSALMDALHSALSLLERIPLSPDAGADDEVRTGIDEVVGRLKGLSDAALAAAPAIPSEPEPPAAPEPDPGSASSPPPREAAAPEPRNKPRDEARAGTAAGTPSAATSPAATVRVAVDRLDAVLYLAEELAPEKLVAAQRAADLWEIQRELAEWRKRWSTLRSRRAARRLAKGSVVARTGPAEDAAVAEFLGWSRSAMEKAEEAIRKLARNADDDRRKFVTNVDELIDGTKKILVQPFSTVLDLVPRMVRDLARELDKQVEVSIRGAEVEVDRRILEMMKDPIIHLVRNAVDHGIESPAERVRLGKPAAGRLEIRVRRLEGGSVELGIADDGGGISLEAVRASAERSGVATAEELARMAESNLRRLIFRSGLTTSKIISDISGRGLGLPILEEQVQKLGGSIDVDSDEGRGTTFTIRLPVTLAALRGTLVKANDHLLAVPSTSIHRVLRVRKSDVTTMENRETIQVNGESVGLVRMKEVLELSDLRKPDGNDHDTARPALLLGAAGPRVAFLVDAVTGEQEIRVKALGTQLERVRNVAGVTQLGTGQLVAVLNVTDLLQSALLVTRTRSAHETGKAERIRSVLIAEDSVTSRVLLENILEGAGYDVTTAADGMSAYDALQQGQFDLVLSDVEMPRMTGFELTERIRQNESTSDLPVVLITSLGNPEDRRRGIDAGANAYIVKSAFDQSDLLSVIENLI